jgi:hypothetical protein
VGCLWPTPLLRRCCRSWLLSSLLSSPLVALLSLTPPSIVGGGKEPACLLRVNAEFEGEGREKTDGRPIARSAPAIPFLAGPSAEADMGEIGRNKFCPVLGNMGPCTLTHTQSPRSIRSHTVHTSATATMG